MIPVVSPNRAVIFAVSGFILYWVLALLVPPLVLRDVFNSLALGTAVVITITWGPAAFQAVRREADSGAWQLILAIFILWSVAMCQRFYTIIFNWYGRPEEWAQMPIAGFWPYSYMIAGFLFLAAPAVSTEGFNPRGVWSLVMAGAIGGMVAGFLIGTSVPSI